MKKGSTKVELVADLEEALTHIKVPKIANEVFRMIIKAKNGYYHDFDSQLATPKMVLHNDLLALGLVEIDKKMQNGDYDNEAPTKEQEKELFDTLKDEILNKKGVN